MSIVGWEQMENIPIQIKKIRDTISKTSGTNIHNVPNFLLDPYGHIGDNGKFSKPTQRRVSSYQFDENVIQLRRDDVQLVSSKWGKDGVGIGLTCHHVIPAELLERFYNMCMLPPYNADNMIAPLFAQWQQNASDSAAATGNSRASMIDPNDPGNYPNELSSACQWMSGNIFIGPDAAKRLDDMGSQDAFDYGGYRQPKKDKIRHDNKKIDKLQTLYTDIKGILSIHPRVMISDNDRQKICSILDRLASLATNHSTLHKRTPNVKSDAYKKEDWVSVGKKVITGMEDFNVDFRAMYRDYCAHNTINDKFSKFCRLFAQYINMNKCNNIIDGRKQYTIARHTYDILYNAWPH